MTTGALIFAYDNETIDYQAMAAWSAGNIRHHLGLPVALVTDTDCRYAKDFDKIIVCPRREDSGSRQFADCGLVSWHNTNRMDAYQLSPWDRTLLLDADYVVASDMLHRLTGLDCDLLAHQVACDITAQNDFSGLNYFGSYGMPMSWATVIMFRRSLHAKLVFESMSMIRNNWRHYRHLYQTGNSVYRNDHALSIALAIANGHCLSHPVIPWNLITVLPEHRLSQVAKDHYRVDYVDSENRSRWLEIFNQDFHAMGKKHLGDIVAKNLT